MKAISLDINDAVDAELATISLEQGCSKADVVARALRRYLDAERLKRMLADPALARLYAPLAAEDAALAEEGISGYHQILDAADRA